jgi:spore coat polysaccharide biosynthesis protein SpsF
MEKIGILVQARMGSTRLPGKVLRRLSGIPILIKQLHRIALNRYGIEPIVITTTLSEDDILYDVVRRYGFRCERGDALDLLDRHYQVSRCLQLDALCKIPSDCPFADPDIIDLVIKAFITRKNSTSYVSNYHPPSFPDGLDVEICEYDALKTAWKYAVQKHEREHTFPFVWDNPHLFGIENVENPLGDMFMTHRWTLDYPEDWDFVQAVYRELGTADFTMPDILRLLDQRPDIARINANLCGVNWYRNSFSKLKTVSSQHYVHEEPT